jgi:hypothetical protein
MQNARIGLIAVMLLMTAGCAAKNVARAMYCEHKTPDGKHCTVWAKHPTECVHDVYGGCTADTK